MSLLKFTIALALLSIANISGVTAQDFPSRPMRLLTPYGAGGSYDGLSRVMATKLSEQLGQQMVVDNRPGAAGRIGMTAAIAMPPDGHNLIMIGNSQAVVPSIYLKVPYDLARDLAPIAMVGSVTNVVVVHPSVPARSLKELVALSKAKSGAIRFGSGGTGGITHLAGELLKSMSGAALEHVPYKSAAQATIANVGGEIEMNVLNMLNAAPNIRANRLRGLAVTSLKRSPFLPDLPTLHESGLKGYDIVEFYVLAVPAGTPAPLIARLHSEIAKAVAAKDVREKFAHLSAEPTIMAPEPTRTFVLEEQKKYARIVKDIGLKPE